MNRVIAWIKRKGDVNSVSYARFGVPGDETDDRPPPTQIVVEPFNELDPEHTVAICCRAHVQRAALIVAAIGMSLSIFFFVVFFAEIQWMDHKGSTDVLLVVIMVLVGIIAVLIHYHVMIGISKGHPKYLLPFIIVYAFLFCFILTFVFMTMTHFVSLASFDWDKYHDENNSTVEQRERSQRVINGYLTRHVLMFIFVCGIVGSLGSMLYVVLRCRQFLQLKLNHSLEMKVAEKAKLQFPDIVIVQAPKGTGPNGGYPMASYENPNHDDAQTTRTQRELQRSGHHQEENGNSTSWPSPGTGPSTHIGIANESIGDTPSPPPPQQQHHTPAENGSRTPTRTLFTSSEQ